jgi:DNA repair exonuclease SbcCD ATPase subunit
MKFIDIIIQNYISFEYVYYNFKKGCTLLQGKNNTDISQETNGTGKTSFQSAIEYVLAGTTSQKLKDKDLIRHGQDSSKIVLQIECLIRSEILKIEREIIRGKSSKVSIYINDIPQKLATVLDCNNFISEWLLISKEDLQNYFIINKERYKNFFQSSHSEKIKIISRFSKGNLIDGVDVYVEKDMQKLHEQKDTLQEKLNTINGKIMAYEEALNFESNRDLEKERQEAIDRLEKTKIDLIAKHEKYEQSIVNNLIDATHLNQEKCSLIDNVDIEINTINKINLDTITQKIDQVENLIKDDIIKRDDFVKDLDLLKKEYYLLEEQISIIDKSLLGVIKCPQCSHEFTMTNEEFDKELAINQKLDLSEKLNHFNLRINQTRKTCEGVIERLNSLYKEKDEFQQKSSLLNKQIDQRHRNIVKQKNRIEECKSKMSIIKNANDEFLRKNEEIDKEVKEITFRIENYELGNLNKKRVDELRMKISDEEQRKDLIFKEIDQLTDQIFNIGKWIFNFKQFKNFLANKFLQTITNACNNYLHKIESDIIVKFEGFTQKRDGSLSEKINALIMRDNIKREYNSYSGGERARLELCSILTIRDLINQSHPYNGLNFLFTDEIFEGLDGKGLAQLTKAAQLFNDTILITTHVNDNQIHTQILIAEKNNGISKLYEY